MRIKEIHTYQLLFMVILISVMSQEFIQNILDFYYIIKVRIYFMNFDLK